MHSTASSNGVKIWKQGYPAALKDGLRMDEVDYVADTHIASVQWAFDAPCPIVKYEWALLRLDNTTLDTRAPQARWVLSAEATQRALAIGKATKRHCREIALCPRASDSVV